MMNNGVGHLSSRSPTGLGQSYGDMGDLGTQAANEGLELGSSRGSSMFSNLTAEDARIVVNRLLQENQDLKNTMLENNSLMKEQCEVVAEWKKSMEEEREEIIQKFNQARTLVTSLRKEKAELLARNTALSQSMRDLQLQLRTAQAVRPARSALPGAVEAEVSGLRIQLQELQRTNKLLLDNKTITDQQVRELTSQLDSLRKQLTQSAGSMDEGKTGSRVSEENYHQMAELESLQEHEQIVNQMATYCASSTNQSNTDIEYVRKLTEDMSQNIGQLQNVKQKLRQDYEKIAEENTILKQTMAEKMDALKKLEKVNQSLEKERGQLIALNNDLNTQLFTKSPGSTSLESSVTLFDRSKIKANKTEDSSGSDVEGYDFVHPQELEAVPAITKESSSQAAMKEPETAPHKHEKLDKTVSDLLVLLREERNKVTDYMSQLATKQEEIDKLRQERDVRQLELQEAKLSMMTTVSQLNQEHQRNVTQLSSQLDALSKQLQATRGQQASVEDVQTLKSQVMSLVREVHEAQQNCEFAKAALTDEKDRSAAIQSKVTILQEEIETQRNKDDMLIESLRGAIHALESDVKSERLALKAEIKDKNIVLRNLEELRKNFDRVCQDYSELLNVVEQQKAREDRTSYQGTQNREYAEKVDNLTAQLVAAEEAMGSKNDEIQQLKSKLLASRNDEETIAVLKAQAEVYQADFEAERQSREQSVAEKESLKDELQMLRRQNQQLLDELETANQHQIAQLQHRHGTYAHEVMQRFPEQHQRPVAGPHFMESFDQSMSRLLAREPSQVTQGQGHAEGHGTSDLPNAVPEKQIPLNLGGELPGTMFTQIGNSNTIHVATGQQPVQLEEEELYQCPGCQTNLPDIDSLQLHVNECPRLN